MNLALAVAVDLVAVLALVTIYFRRHHRRDLVLAYVALNIGILVVTAVMAGSGAGIGLGLGLFGILSIIRLRSDAITQEEIAYYFVALVMGLVAGIHPSPGWAAPLTCTALVVVMYAADHPRFAARTRRHLVLLDHAHPDPVEREQVLAALLGGTVLHVEVIELDLVRDVTQVDVRFRLPATSPTASRPVLRRLLPAMT